MSLGKTFSEILARASIAAPELTPLAGEPFKVIAEYILNLFIWYGPTISLVDITALKGTILP